MTGPQPTLGVSTLLLHEGRALLVRRARAPLSGLWALPGGRVRYRESLREAARRELLEETGVTGANFRRLDVVEIVEPDGVPEHFVLVVFQGDFLSGTPTAGGDAAEARWVGLDEYRSLPLAEQTRAILDRHAGNLAHAR